MKTQIIQLYSHDDFISVRDKMGWSQTERILFVWPDSDQILDDRLELKLVKRHTEKLGAKLTLVTQDKTIHSIGRQLGIEVVKNLQNANDSPQQKSNHKKDNRHRNNIRPDLEHLHKLVHYQGKVWKDHPFIRLISFGTSVLALLAIGIFILPGATVILYPQIKTQSMTFPVSADPALEAINFTTASLPTETREVVVEGHKSVDTTASVLVPDQFAQGTFRIMNPTDHSIRIPTRSVIYTPGAQPNRFITTAAEEITLESGKTVDLNAQSLLPGTVGNIPAGSLAALEGDPSKDLVVTNPEATYGGTDVLVPSPSEQDTNALYDSLVEELEQAAIAELQTTMLEKDVLVLPGLVLSELLDKTYSPEVGEPGKKLNLSLRIQFQGQVVTSQTLHRLIDPILDAGITPGYIPVKNSMRIKRLSNPETDEGGDTHWTLQVQRDLRLMIPSNLVIQYVKGLPVSEATSLMNHLFPYTQSPQIKVTPAWWPRLPYVAMRIHLVQVESQ